MSITVGGEEIIGPDITEEVNRLMAAGEGISGDLQFKDDRVYGYLYPFEEWHRKVFGNEPPFSDNLPNKNTLHAE